jgi:hypothetical protein
MVERLRPRLRVVRPDNTNGHHDDGCAGCRSPGSRPRSPQPKPRYEERNAAPLGEGAAPSSACLRKE